MTNHKRLPPTWRSKVLGLRGVLRAAKLAPLVRDNPLQLAIDESRRIVEALPNLFAPVPAALEAFPRVRARFELERQGFVWGRFGQADSAHALVHSIATLLVADLEWVLRRDPRAWLAPTPAESAAVVEQLRRSRALRWEDHGELEALRLALRVEARAALAAAAVQPSPVERSRVPIDEFLRSLRLQPKSMAETILTEAVKVYPGQWMTLPALLGKPASSADYRVADRLVQRGVLEERRTAGKGRTFRAPGPAIEGIELEF